MADQLSDGTGVSSLNPQTTPAWQALEWLVGYYARDFDLRKAFATEPKRFQQHSVHAPHMLVDLSKNLWDEPVVEQLLALAVQMGLPERRSQLLNGEIVNHTEHQAAVHAALRLAFASDRAVALPAMAQNCSDLNAMLAMAETIRADATVHDVVHIGIGGSSLGPELVLQALQPYWRTQQRIHVVSNLDGHDLAETLAKCHPAHTVFIAASKSWSTLETLQNLRSATGWLQQNGINPTDRVVAITAKPDAAQATGLKHTLSMPADIGGRYSVWCAVGLPVAVAIGAAGFRKLLAGAAAMDEHFAQAPLAHNAPVLLGLLDVWYSSFMRLPSRCVAPYHHRLRRLPAYLQQLDMESNGKTVRQNGDAVGYATGMTLWGEAGSNGQHAFFQWLHQGQQRTPVEFVAASQAEHALPGHHTPLLANAVGQAQALMLGSKAGLGQLPGHQDFPGNRPSTFLLLDGPLSPPVLGALLALYEHRTFVSGVVWGINSFDQWGVELGKVLANDLLQRVPSGSWQGLDESTAGLLNAACVAAEVHS